MKNNMVKLYQLLFGSLKKKMAGAFILVYTVISSVSCWYSISFQTDRNYYEYKKDLRDLSRIVSERLGSSKKSVNDSTLNATMERLFSYTDLKAIAVYGKNNELLGSGKNMAKNGKDENVYFDQKYSAKAELNNSSVAAWFFYSDTVQTSMGNQLYLVLLVSNQSYVQNNKTDVHLLLLNYLICFILFAVLAILLSYFIVLSISKVSNNLNKIAKLDDSKVILTGILHKEKLYYQDLEIKILTDEINNVLTNYNDKINELKIHGSVIKDYSNDLSENIMSFSSAIIQQGSATAQTSSAFEELGVSIKTISKSAEAIVEVAEKTKQSSEEGVRAATETMNTILKIQSDNILGREKLYDLGNKTQRISSVLKSIQDLNDQTQLISFNAMIEAVGAGNAGRRFKVVASEIKELSDNLEKEGKIIKSILTEISEYTLEVIQDNKKLDPIIANSISSAETLTNKLKEINEFAHLTNDNLKNICYATDQQDKAVNEVIISMREITSGSESFMEGSYKIQEVADKLQEISNEILV